MQTPTCLEMYTCIHAHAHTYIHTYIHTYRKVRPSASLLLAVREDIGHPRDRPTMELLPLLSKLHMNIHTVVCVYAYTYVDVCEDKWHPKDRLNVLC